MLSRFPRGVLRTALVSTCQLAASRCHDDPLLSTPAGGEEARSAEKHKCSNRIQATVTNSLLNVSVRQSKYILLFMILLIAALVNNRLCLWIRLSHRVYIS